MGSSAQTDPLPIEQPTQSSSPPSQRILSESPLSNFFLFESKRRYERNRKLGLLRNILERILLRVYRKKPLKLLTFSTAHKSTERANIYRWQQKTAPMLTHSVLLLISWSSGFQTRTQNKNIIDQRDKKFQIITVLFFISRIFRVLVYLR